MTAENIRLKGMRFARLMKEKGPATAMKKGIRVVSRPIFTFGSIRFFTARLDSVPVPVALDRSLELTFATPADAAALTMDRLSEEVVEEIRNRFARGDRCIAVRDGSGKILHSRWLTDQPTRIPEIGLYIVPDHTQRYMYDGYTRADARRRGIDSAVRDHIFRVARNEGAREVLSYVRSRNIAGLKAAGKMQSDLGGIPYIALFKSKRIAFGQRRIRRRVQLMSDAELRQREQDYLQRKSALGQWFESWSTLPMERRSTGFSPLPDDCLQQTARHIATTLRLDPRRDRVLDVGCASAGVSRHVAPQARAFHGVDATAGLVADIEPGSVRCGSGQAAEFSVADGRELPFPDGAFDKVYCSGVIHMLPSRDDAMEMVEELIRVCSPGGQVLVAAVPDLAKGGRARLLAWRRSNLRGKIRLGAAMATPRPLRRFLQNRGLVGKDPIAFMEFDLRALKDHYEERGFGCQVLDFPADYWSQDFRTSRSNLLITIPRARISPAP